MWFELASITSREVCGGLTLSSTAGGRPSSRASDCTQNSLATRRTAMRPRAGLLQRFEMWAMG